MKIKIIGCSTAFSGLDTFNQSFLIEENDKRLLIDCGEDTPKALIYHGIDTKSIDGIYISHLHADHCFGIPRFALSRYDFMNIPTHYSQGNYAPKLYGKKQILENLWESVRHPLETLQNVKGNLETFFEPVPVTDHFVWEGWNFRLIQQVHVVSDAEIMPSFGLIISKEGHKSIYLTTDSQYCSPRQIEDFYRLADIIIQDCELIGVNTILEEGSEYYIGDNSSIIPWPTIEEDPDGMKVMELLTFGIEKKSWKRSKFSSGVHANWAQLAGYPSANSTKISPEEKSKMWLSHYQDFKHSQVDMCGNKIDWDAEAKKEGFAGFVKTGQVFEI